MVEEQKILEILVDQDASHIRVTQETFDAFFANPVWLLLRTLGHNVRSAALETLRVKDSDVSRGYITAVDEIVLGAPTILVQYVTDNLGDLAKSRVRESHLRELLKQIPEEKNDA